MELRGTTKEAYQKAWLAAAREELGDATRSAELARTLVKKLPVGTDGGFTHERDQKRYKAFLARVTALAARTCDAETALALVAMLAEAPLRVARGEVVYGPVIDLVAAIAAPAAVLGLEELLAQPTADTATVRDYFATALPPVIAALAKHGRPVRPAKRKRAARTDLDALYAEIVAAPEDDAPRMVYADALLERGDSRGTFIQAQLAAPADPKAGATILRKDEKQWIGDVARISKNRVWRRGFLDELQLLQGAVADPETWQRATTNPALATLRTLHKETASEALYATFVNSRTLVNLRDFEVPSRKFAEHLVRLARPGITHLELGFRISAANLALVDQLVARLGVTRFAIMTAHDVPASLDIVEHWANRTQLTELTLVPVPGRFQDWRAGAPTWLAATKRLGIPRLGAFAYDTRMFSS